MIENKNCANVKSFKLSALAAGVAMVAGAFAAPAYADTTFESDSGWKAGFNGHIPIFAVLGYAANQHLRSHSEWPGSIGSLPDECRHSAW